VTSYRDLAGYEIVTHTPSGVVQDVVAHFWLTMLDELRS
jgi:hypothetical protein